ncbi:hypothetical protein FOA52_016124 [Chlamydomonas sp. UWO 241]|nr:hypothetical protein FOA52_016124 [Chlamydomonas sp. UWO 241]
MCYVAMLLALLLAAGSPCWVHAADTVITVGGSGTSNTGPFMWKFMSAVESWTSPLIHLAYRSVGSGFGQSDFVNGGAAISGNDFGCGDLALPTAQWDQVAVSGNPALQIPYLINPVSFFHSIPGVPNGDVANALQLDCVTLAGIFTGQITKWSHPSIRALNPSLSASLAEMTIRVVTRTPGSSSTYGISTYMSKACPAAWGDWDIGGTVSQWGTMWTPAVSASNAQQVVEELLGEPYSIGYIESGQGVEAGLKELRIQARGSGRYVYHGAANFSDAFLASVLQIGTLPAPVENWGEWETLMWLDPSAGGGDSGDTWPIVLVTFFYARENVTWLGPEAGGLLKTFMQLVLSDTGATFITELGMVPLPKSLRDYYSAYIGANVTTAVGGPVWQTELGSKDASTLNADYVVSKYRNTYTSYQTFNMEADVAVLQTNAVRGFGYQVHGSGAFAPATAIRLLMQQLTEQSREPIQTSYRAIPGETTDEEFVAYARNVRQYNQFFVGNVPLSSEQMRKLALRPSPPRAMGTRSKTLKDLNNLNLMALGAGMAAIAADAAAAAGGAGAGEESMEGVMVVAGTPSPRACLLTPGRGTRGATNAEVPSSAMSSPVRAPADHDEMHMGIPPPDPSAAMHRGMRELLREEFAEQRDLIREEFSRGMAALAARVTETEARVAGVIAAVATLDARITSKFAQADVAFGPLLRLVPELSVAKDGVADLDERMGRMEKHEVLALAQFHVDQGKSREMAAKVAALTEQWATLRETTPGRRGAVQIPFAAAALGIYHSQILPGFDLRLTACDVARIYARRVTTWNELLPAAERSASTAFPILLLGYPSTHTNLGTMQAYLDKACPSVSVDLVATGQSLSQGIGSSSAWDTILSPELMIELLETTPHAIGFVQSSFVSPGSRLYPVLLEAPTFGGGVTYLAPTADNAANALELLWDQEDSVPIDFSDDWSKVSALALAPTTSSAGSDKPAGYPITQIMFFYLYQNMDEFDASGPLTKALVSFALDTDGQALFSSRGLAPLPLSLRPAAKAALDTIMVDPLLAHWTVEAKDEFSDAGMQQFSLSGNRLTALAGQMQTLTDGIATLTAAASAALPSVIVVAADSDSAPVLLHALDRLDALSSHPLKSVVEYVPGGAAALLSANPPRVQMALLERPLDASEQLALATHSQAAVQVPLFVRPVALSVWMPGDALVTIRLGPCALARILVGEIDRWDHPDIVALLAPGSDKSQLPSGPFEVFAASRTGGDLLAAVAYAAKGCPARSSALNATLLRVRTPADGSTTSAATLFRSAGAMTGLLVASRYAIDSQTAPVQRFLAPMIDSLQHDLVEVQLQAADSSFVDTLSGYSDATRAAPPSLAVMDARYAAMLDAALAKATAASAASRIVWADVASSLISGALPSDMVPATLRGPMYPVVRLDLLAVLADLSSFNASGAAAAAAAQALTSSAFQALLRPDVLYGQDGSLGLAMLGARASSVAAAALGGDALRLRGARWRVVESSEGAAADLVAPTLNTGLALNALYNFGTAKPPVEAATALAVMLEQRWVTLAEVESRANEAYKLAVAAIVLAAVLWGALFFAALAILIFRPRPLRGGGGGSGSAGAGGASGPGVGVRRSAASFDNPVCCLPLSAPMAQPKDEMLLGHGGNDSDNHATLTPVAKTASANGKGSAGLGSGGEDTTAHVKTPVARAGNGNGVRTGPQASPPLPTSTHGGPANAV